MTLNTPAAGTTQHPLGDSPAAGSHVGPVVQAGAKATGPALDRIFANVDVGVCWEWQGYRNSLGYGRLSLGGRLVLAHRAVWELLVSPVPEGLELDHLCRNPPCVNPDHLEPVTHRENVRRGATGRRRRTTCPQGHPYDDANTSITTGHRRCRECARIRSAERRAADPEWTRALDRARYAARPEVFRERQRLRREAVR